MGSFEAGAFVVLMILYGMFCLGQWTKAPDFAHDCNQHGQFTVRGVVFQCKPVAAMVNGKRVELSP